MISVLADASRVRIPLSDGSILVNHEEMRSGESVELVMIFISEISTRKVFEYKRKLDTG